MSLMNAIRRVAAGKGGARLEDKHPEEAEDDELDTEAEGEETETEAEGDEDETSAEDEETEAEGDDEDADAEEEKEETEARKMSKAERSAFAKGRKAERGRIGRILGSKSAQANPALAAHLAFNTSDRASKALGVLKAGGAAAAGKLASRMGGRPASRTGRGGDAVRGSRDAGASWGKALAKAGVASPSRKS